MKLALIIDKSESYISFQVSNIWKEWNVDESEVDKAVSFSTVGEETIFGDAPPVQISMNDLTQWKKLVSDIEEIDKKSSLEDKVKSGVIISSTLARNSTKRLEELVKKHGGKVVVAKESAKDKTNISEKMLSSLFLNREAKDFLVEYAADDYESLVSVVQALSILTPKQQKNVSINDLLIRLPLPPGSIPPWEIEKPLFSGNADETIQKYRRITLHSHYLVVLSLLKNKILLSWRISSLLNAGESPSSIPGILGVPNNYPFKLALENSKKIGLEKLTKINETLLTAEKNVKGGSSADDSGIIEIMLIKIVNIVRG